MKKINAIDFTASPTRENITLTELKTITKTDFKKSAVLIYPERIT